MLRMAEAIFIACFIVMAVCIVLMVLPLPSASP